MQYNNCWALLWTLNECQCTRQLPAPVVIVSVEIVLIVKRMVHYNIDTIFIYPQLFNMRRLKAKTKVKATSIVYLQYADDCAIAAHTEADLQNTLDAFSEAYQLLGLTVNVTKTKVLFQPAQPLTATAPNIDIEGTILENVDHFAYLATSRSRQTSM